jgi:hypothetical protein
MVSRYCQRQGRCVSGATNFRLLAARYERRTDADAALPRGNADYRQANGDD